MNRARSPARTGTRFELIASQYAVARIALFVALVLTAPAPVLADTTPDAFAFAPVAGVAAGSRQLGRTTITGIDEPARITVVASTGRCPAYAIDCQASALASFAYDTWYPYDAPIAIRNGQTLCVAHTVPCWGCTSFTELDVGGVRARFETTSVSDRETDPIRPAPKLQTRPGTVVDFDPVTVTGFDTPVPVIMLGTSDQPGPIYRGVVASVSIGCTGTYTSAPASIAPGEQLCVRHVAGDAATTLTTTEVIVGYTSVDGGGYAKTVFASTHGSTLDTTPDPFAFTSFTWPPSGWIGVRRGRTMSACADIVGLQGPSFVTATGGRALGLDGYPAFYTGVGTLCVDHVAATTFGTSTTTMLDVGGVRSTFTSRTIERAALSGGSTADFGGDGQHDLLWRNPVTGDTVLWTMSSTILGSWSRWTALVVGRPEWSVALVGDFEGDTVSDLLWRNATTGETAIWLMADGAMRQSAVVVADPAWTATHVGDFDGDGTSDIVWSNATTGETSLWLMNGLVFRSGGTLLFHPDWRVQRVADLDGDGKSDLVWRNALTGETAAWMMDGLTRTSGQVLLARPDWSVSAAGDFDDDGASDLVWHNPALGLTAIWLMQGTTMKSGAIVPTGALAPVGVADLDADGKADLLVPDAGGTTIRYLMNGLAVRSATVVLGPGEMVRKTLDLFGDGWSGFIHQSTTAQPCGNRFQFHDIYAAALAITLLCAPDWQVQ